MHRLSFGRTGLSCSIPSDFPQVSLRRMVFALLVRLFERSAPGFAERNFNGLVQPAVAVSGGGAVCT